MTPPPPLLASSINLPPPPPAEEEVEEQEEESVGNRPEDTLHHILTTLVPFLLVAALSVKSFTSKWRNLHSKLTQLSATLSSVSRCATSWTTHPLFPTLLSPLLSTLLSLRSLSRRCNQAHITGGKLLLQSDLDIACSSLDLHLHDLHLLLPFLLPSPSSSSSSSSSSSCSSVSNTPTATAIVLSDPNPSSSKEDISLFVRDLFARLLIGGVELKKKALDSLLRLLTDCGALAAAIVAEEGDVACLIHLLDSSNQSVAIRELAVAAVAGLAAASDDSRKAVFEEGGLGPLLRLLDSGSAAARDNAANAVESITADPNNAWAVAAYGGIAVLISACHSDSGGSPLTRAKASGSLRNVVSAGIGGEVKETLVEEGGILVLTEMLGDENVEIRRNAAHCLWIMASGGERYRVLILQDGGLPKLLHLFREYSGDVELMEHVLRAFHLLSSLPSASKTLSGSSVFLSQLAELIGRHQGQHIAASLLCNLSLNEEGKRAMAGCMAPLVKMMTGLLKPAGSQEIAARALVSLLSARCNRKEFTKDEKSMNRLVQMLDPRSSDGVCKKLPVSVVLVLSAGGSGGGGGGCRKKIVAAGACQHLQKLAELDVPGAKKALQRISGGRLKNLFSSISWRE